MYKGTLDLLVFKIILESFGALVSIWPVTPGKWLAAVKQCNLRLRGSFTDSIYITYMGNL